MEVQGHNPLAQTLRRKAFPPDPTQTNEEQQDDDVFTAPTVALIGWFNKGKTHVLNLLSGQQLPEGSTEKSRTRGISFKIVPSQEQNRPAFIFADSAGLNSPVKSMHNCMT